MRCDGCKWWETPSGDGIADLGNCVKAMQLWDVTHWVDDDPRPGVYRAILPEHKDQMSFVQDGSSYHAELLTKAEFFCAHHEAVDVAVPMTMEDVHGNAS